MTIHVEGWPGTWRLSSRSDPRWNCERHSDCVIEYGPLPKELHSKIEELKSKLGKQPEDLEWSFRRD